MLMSLVFLVGCPVSLVIGPALLRGGQAPDLTAQSIRQSIAAATADKTQNLTQKLIETTNTLKHHDYLISPQYAINLNTATATSILLSCLCCSTPCLTATSQALR